MRSGGWVSLDFHWIGGLYGFLSRRHGDHGWWFRSTLRVLRDSVRDFKLDKSSKFRFDLLRKLAYIRNNIKAVEVTQSIDSKVISRIYGKKRGWTFSPTHFSDLGDRPAVGMALSRLAKRGVIDRIARGLYLYPEKHPVLGNLSPSPEAISKAIASGDKVRLVPTGAYAANRLGLSEQVPAKITFLTDGLSRTVKVGKRTIELKRTTPRNLGPKRESTALLIQALRYLGEEAIDSKTIRFLKSRLSPEDRTALLKDLSYAPEWMRKILKQIAGEATDG